MTLARDLGYDVYEAVIQKKEIFNADEAFFTGTATEISAIQSIDEHVFNYNQSGPITARIKNLFSDIITGKNTGYKDWFTYI